MAAVIDVGLKGFFQSNAAHSVNPANVIWVFAVSSNLSEHIQGFRPGVLDREIWKPPQRCPDKFAVPLA
ncbi:hypothetical protein D3C79_880070 [compost metagenome]